MFLDYTSSRAEFTVIVIGLGLVGAPTAMLIDSMIEVEASSAAPSPSERVQREATDQLQPVKYRPSEVEICMTCLKNTSLGKDPSSCFRQCPAVRQDSPGNGRASGGAVTICKTCLNRFGPGNGCLALCPEPSSHPKPFGRGLQ